MENLPEKANVQNVALEIYNPKPGTKAIEIRRKMVQLPEVAKALNPVEKYIFAASTKTQISEIDDETLVTKLANMLKYIAMDVGFIIPQITEDWQYIQARTLDILKRYYSNFTLSDIKLAFELATTGELDEFLPKDKQGNPDKNHYQQFNAEYLSKILNAYKRKQNVVIDKAFKVFPEPKTTFTPAMIREFEIQRQWRNRYIFLCYKYTGKLILGLTDDMFLYEWLQKCGLADDVQVKEDDRKEAFARYMQRVARGMINQYTAFQVRRKGTESPEIDFTAFEVARKKEIIKAFDRMIAEEMQVDNYMKF
nr:MAG: hypothetical protein [Bacteriophage sp.]